MTQKTMTPKDFEEWLKAEKKTHPYISVGHILSQFRTVKWEKGCDDIDEVYHNRFKESGERAKNQTNN